MKQALNHKFALGWCLVFLMMVRPSAAQVKHIRFSKTDQFIACTERVLGKRVLWGWMYADIYTRAVCPVDRSSAMQSLERQGIRVLENDEWAALYPAQEFDKDSSLHRPISCTGLQVSVSAQNVTDTDLELTTTELQTVQRIVLEQARLFPVATPDMESGKCKIALKIAVYTATGNDKVRVSALLVSRGYQYQTGRVAFGRWDHGEFQLLWDSPLTGSYFGEIRLTDLNDDGNPEILVNWETDGNITYPRLVAFDQAGQEMTRQVQCEAPEGADCADGTCPLAGRDFQIQPEPGKYIMEIAVQNWSGRKRKETTIFRLQNGHYTPIPSHER